MSLQQGLVRAISPLDQNKQLPRSLPLQSEMRLPYTQKPLLQLMILLAHRGNEVSIHVGLAESL